MGGGAAPAANELSIGGTASLEKLRDCEGSAWGCCSGEGVCVDDCDIGDMLRGVPFAGAFSPPLDCGDCSW